MIVFGSKAKHLCEIKTVPISVTTQGCASLNDYTYGIHLSHSLLCSPISLANLHQFCSVVAPKI